MGEAGAGIVTGYVTDPSGALIRLPAPLSWTFSYTCGVPVTAFGCGACGTGQRPLSRHLGGFQAWEGPSGYLPAWWTSGEVVLSGQGSFLEVTGRGMAARLLDNEALGQDYQAATPQDILRTI